MGRRSFLGSRLFRHAGAKRIVGAVDPDFIGDLFSLHAGCPRQDPGVATLFRFGARHSLLSRLHSGAKCRRLGGQGRGSKDKEKALDQRAILIEKIVDERIFVGVYFARLDR